MISLEIRGSSKTIELSRSTVIGIGLNYRAHVAESRIFKAKPVAEPIEPILFCKTSNVLVPHGDPIVLPKMIDRYGFNPPRTDYEAELAVVIGKACRRISPEHALDYVLGYTCFNDVTQRNLQKNDTSGWFRGKSFDSFGPIGPWIVPAADVPHPSMLRITGRLNGTVVQQAPCAAMIFDVPTIISFVSQHLTLQPGDIITTGTPEGVGPLKAGDVFEVEIDGIGILRNPVVDEPRDPS